jgi:hypothetical protein
MPETKKIKVAVAQVWHLETVLEIEVPEGATDAEVRAIASEQSCNVSTEEWNCYDWELIHVEHEGRYL